MDKIKFGSYIKESRIRKNYTQQELAELLFVDVSTVSKWERGVSYPDITMVPDICRVLDISEHELIASSHDEEYRKMKTDASKYNNMKKSTFWTLNISYLVSILICFIVNVAVNHTLSWFFIVLTSVMCAYSFCPTITWLFTKYKKLSFIVSSFISLFLLFLTCSIQTNNYWFMIATIAVLLGYFIMFYPMLFKLQKKYLTIEKYNKLSRWFLFSYTVGMFVIVSLLLICIYFYESFNLKLAFLIVGGVFMIPVVFGVLNLFEISKNLNKPILLSLLGVIILAIIAGLCNAAYLKSTETSKIYVIEEVYNDIKINGDNFDVSVYLTNSNENKVVYMVNKKVSVDISVENGVLDINQNDNRKFYDKLFNFSNFKVKLYLSCQALNSLIIDNKTGDIDISKGFTFENVNIDNSTGDVSFKSNVTNNFSVVNSTGDIELEDCNVGGNIIITNKTGDIDLVNVKGNKLDIKISTGDTELDNTIIDTDFKLVGSTGDVDFDGFDASNIDVSVTTGDVEGTILTSKIFIVRSSTGVVKVPETVTGGTCKIVTKTGNIKISYK